MTRLLTAFLVVAVGGQDPKPRDHEAMHRLHQDPKAYVAMLEDPARDAYQKPEEVLRALGLRRGELVADIGSGLYSSVKR